MSEYEEVIVRLDKANTIIGEIVRCKDCRWYQDYDGCFFSTAEVEPLDYCSYGERKTEEENIREVARGFMELVDATADRKTEPQTIVKEMSVTTEQSSVVGEWQITEAYPHNVYCSECHKRFAQTHWGVWEDGSLPRNFCPNCGAKMKGGTENE